MKIINADVFVADMEKLYRDHGWEDKEAHFSLNDLKGNIDAAKTYKQEIPRWIVYHIDPYHPRNFSDLIMPGDYYICPICGRSNSIATNYCPYCGEKLGEAKEAEENE